ncbi:MAG: M1 family peptidase, partial [Actinobacteria bacterium]|nr:M1 family peptidase [Actinomycetota bacterium]
SCSDAYRPDWRVWDTFARARSAAFDVDALASTRPIEFPVVTPQEAEGMFDLLTYEKGASVVRMLEQYLGAEVFRDGVRHYLDTHSYANTETTDLWASLETISGQPVQSLMHNWIYQGGHPIITATATPHGLRVEQRAFTLDRDVADDRTWSVPLVIRHDGETTSALLTERSMLLTGITGTPTTVNAGAAGFFRTAIDEAILAELEANGPGDRTPTERHGLVDDAWALTVAGSLSAVDFLRLARALAGEDDLNVWQALATGLHGLDRLVEGSAADVLAGTIRELAGPALASIGFEPGAGDDDRTLELRATLVRLLGTAGNDAEVIAAAKGAVDHAEASLGA